MNLFSKNNKNTFYQQHIQIQTHLFNRENFPQLLQFDSAREPGNSQKNKYGCLNHRNNKKQIIRPFQVLQKKLDPLHPKRKINESNKQQYRLQARLKGCITTKGQILEIVFNKQNQAGSINEPKGHHFIQVKTNFCKTERYSGLKQYLHQSERHEEHPVQTQMNKCKEKRSKIYKSLSRRTFSRGRKDQKHQTEGQEIDQSSLKQNKTHRLTCSGTPTLQDFVQNGPRKHQQKNSIQMCQHEAPQNGLFDLYFSTIKLKQKEDSTFLTRQSVDELIKPIKSSIQNHQSKLIAKRRNNEIDKIKKKFPQHFFK